jgi:hypothetical protein
MCPPVKISSLKQALSDGNKKDLPVYSEMGQVLVSDTEGKDDGSLLEAPFGSLLGVLLCFSDGVLLGLLIGVELGETEDNGGVSLLGALLGSLFGLELGLDDDTKIGFNDGLSLGLLFVCLEVGCDDGLLIGALLGLKLGIEDGLLLGLLFVGLEVGCDDGSLVLQISTLRSASSILASSA